MMEYFEAVQNRRSIYALEKKSTLSDERLEELLTRAVQHAPSAFDSRSSRLLLLLGEAHQRLWDLVLEALRPLVPEKKFAGTERRIVSFAAGYGTVLFYEEESVVHALQERYPQYSENFPVWSQQSSGMLQYLVWTGLEAEGLGASLQHYNPLIDEQAAAVFAVPGTWRLIAQMPFGKPSARPEPRQEGVAGERLRVIGR